MARVSLEADRAYQRQYRADNHEKVRAREKRGYERRHEKEILRMRSYKAQRKEQDAAYAKAYYEINAEDRRAYARQWGLENPEQRRQINARRRARERNAFIEDIDRQTVLEHDEGICGICEEPVDRDNFHIDHIVPLSRSGLHCYANVQVAHPQCNLEKWATCQS